MARASGVGGGRIDDGKAPDPLLGRRLAGRYLVEGHLGKGGMGVVYRGRQEPLGRPVALKVLAAELAGDPAVVQRFEKEALAVARLNHPNIVTVYELGRTAEGLLFLAMELLEGESLFARLRRGPLEPALSLDVMTQVARALAEAHAQGIVHRDLKPENIMLLEGRDEELLVKVLDFGLAKMVGVDQGGAPLTSASVIMGTPGYMSPEQIHAKAIDARTDLYALGMVWWEMLVGRRPFDAASPIELLVQHLQRPLPAPTTARPQLTLPARMERLVLRLGEKDPNARPDDGAALLGELRALREDAWAVDAASGALAGASDDEWDAAFQAVSEAPPPLGPSQPTERFPVPPPAAPTIPEVSEPAAQPPEEEPPLALTEPVADEPPPSPFPLPGTRAKETLGQGARSVVEPQPAFVFPPPRPPPPSAFRPPPDPLANAEPLELGRPDAARAASPSSRDAVAPPDARWPVRRVSGASASPLPRRVALLGLFAVAALCGAVYGLAPDAVEARLASLLDGLGIGSAPEPVLQNPLERHFKRWRNELGVPTASAPEALALARTAIKQERVRGRREADAALRLGLLVEPDNVHLLATFAENRAWLRAMGHLLDEIPAGPVAAYARARARSRDDVEVLRASAAVSLLAKPAHADVPRDVEEALAAAARLDDQDPGVQLLLALARLSAPAAALGHAERALAGTPGSTRARLALGMAARRLGRLDEAIQHLEARARAEPADALAGRELALALLERGLPRRATRALETTYAETGDPETARLFALAVLGEPAGERRADVILAEATKSAERAPGGAALLALRTRLLVHLGSAAQAVVLAQDATRRFRRDGEVKAALAHAYAAAGRVVEARRAYAEAESLAPGPSRVAALRQARGDLELRAGQRAAADEAYAHSSALAPARVGPRLALALLAFERGDDDEAGRALMGLLDVDPRQDRDRDPLLEPFAAAPFALYRQRAGELLARDTSVTAHVLRGVTAFHAGELKAARRSLAAALRHDRAQPVALLYSAALDLEEGEPASAQRRLQVLEATVPASRAVALYLARVEATDKPERAEARLTRLANEGLFPVEVETVRGAIAAARRRAESATRHYEAALLKDPRYLPARHALLPAPPPDDR